MDNIKNKDDYNPDIVTLSDDDGKEYTFEVLDAKIGRASCRERV